MPMMQTRRRFMTTASIAGGMSLLSTARALATKELLRGDIVEADLILAAQSSRAVFGKMSSNLTALRDELARLQKLIRKRGRRLCRDALELGRRFYAEPPKAFAKRISIFISKRT